MHKNKKGSAIATTVIICMLVFVLISIILTLCLFSLNMTTVGAKQANDRLKTINVQSEFLARGLTPDSEKTVLCGGYNGNYILAIELRETVEDEYPYCVLVANVPSWESADYTPLQFSYKHICSYPVYAKINEKYYDLYCYTGGIVATITEKTPTTEEQAIYKSFTFVSSVSTTVNGSTIAYTTYALTENGQTTYLYLKNALS